MRALWAPAVCSPHAWNTPVVAHAAVGGAAQEYAACAQGSSSQVERSAPGASSVRSGRSCASDASHPSAPWATPSRSRAGAEPANAFATGCTRLSLPHAVHVQYRSGTESTALTVGGVDNGTKSFAACPYSTAAYAVRSRVGRGGSKTICPTTVAGTASTTRVASSSPPPAVTVAPVAHHAIRSTGLERWTAGPELRCERLCDPLVAARDAWTPRVRVGGEPRKLGRVHAVRRHRAGDLDPSEDCLARALVDVDACKHGGRGRACRRAAERGFYCAQSVVQPPRLDAKPSARLAVAIRHALVP